MFVGHHVDLLLFVCLLGSCIHTALFSHRTAMSLSCCSQGLGAPVLRQDQAALQTCVSKVSGCLSGKEPQACVWQC